MRTCNISFTNFRLYCKGQMFNIGKVEREIRIVHIIDIISYHTHFDVKTIVKQF